jgi:hypothetical protein
MKNNQTLSLNIDGLVETLTTNIKNVIESQQGPVPPKWIDTSQLCKMLNISKRTAQNYRDKGLIPFTKLFGKVWYDENEVHRALEQHKNDNNIPNKP